MLELGFGPEIVRAIQVLYWVLGSVALCVALLWPKTITAKFLVAVAVVVLFGYMPAKVGWQANQAKEQQESGLSYFQMRCKESGERITRKVEGVDGIALLKIRPATVNYEDQFTPDDVYGHDRGADDYIKSFLRVTQGADLKNEFGRLVPAQYLSGYAFVEALDPKDGKHYRFTLAHKVMGKRSTSDWDVAKKNVPGIGDEMIDIALEREQISVRSARHGVTWADISTREDREHWVAGGVLQIVDLQSDEVIAERRGFMWDRQMGSRAAGRSPWLEAEFDACPSFIGKRGDGSRARTMVEARFFVNSVLGTSN